LVAGVDREQVLEPQPSSLLSSQSSHVLQKSREKAKALGHDQVAPTHLLLALLGDAQSNAGQIP